MTAEASKEHPASDELLARHAAWWQREGLLYTDLPGQPLSELRVPLADGRVADADLDLRPDMLDLGRLVGENQGPGPLQARGDQLETRAAFTRVPWLEAILGCRIRTSIQSGSMRAHSWVESWDDWEKAPHWHQEWLDALLELTRLLAARSGGRYAVTQTLMRGPSDLAEAVLGPELTCLSIYDQPSKLRGFLEEVTDVFVRVLRAQLDIISPVEDGYVNPFGIWAPGTTVRTQCDASAFLSPRQYAEWFLPYDQRISEAVDYSVIHLHSGSLHTVQPLMTVEHPLAIQVSIDPEPASPPVPQLVPAFRHILAGKPLIVDGPMSRQDADLLLEELPHDGLCMLVRSGTW